jgi:hypothetical protein
MKEYDLYVPLTYNDGTPIEPKRSWARPRLRALFDLLRPRL